MLLFAILILLLKIKVLRTSTVPRNLFFTTPTAEPQGGITSQPDRTPTFVQGVTIAMVIVTVILIIILIFLAFKLWKSGLMKFGKHRNIYETPDIPLDTHGSEFAAAYETNFGPLYENVSGPASHTNNTLVVDNAFAKALIDSRYDTVKEVEEEEEEEKEENGKGSVHKDQDNIVVEQCISEKGTNEGEIAIYENMESQDGRNEVESANSSCEGTSEI